MTDLIGKSLGRYHILEKLGEGGMASVYIAMDTRLERRVAIKVIRKDVFGSLVLDQVLKRFEREAKSLARLSHPTIVGVFDFGEYEGAPYLVMEYVPGGTLKKMTGKPLPWQKAVRLLLPVAKALSFAHENGIIHRDIKPANILMTGGGEPRLSDFGVAKILETTEGMTLTGTGVGIGTPEYMAPEQGLGIPIDGRADIYALGVVLYELVTGRKPYTADTPIAIVLKHVNDPLPNPKEYIPDLPDEVFMVLVKALAKRPEDRYPDMPAFEAALERLSNLIEQPSWDDIRERPKDNETIAEPVPQFSETPKTRLHWKPWLVAGGGLIGLSVIVAICAVGFIVFRSRQGKTAQSPTPTLAILINATNIAEDTQAPATEAVSLASTQKGNESATESIPTQTSIPSETSAPTVIQPVNQPQGKIVFTCQVFKDGKRNQICVIDADGSGFQRLTTDADDYDHTYPTWSPDGDGVLFSSNRSGEYAIYEMTLAGKITQVTDGSREAYAPDVSPDGRWIVYTIRAGDFQELWLMERNGEGDTPVYASDSSSAWDAVWSPDGSRILFASDRMGGIQLFTMSRNGTDIRQVTSMAGLRGRSDWSPDGVTIATYAGESWHREIFVINLVNGDYQQITQEGNNLAPSFSSDGGWFAYTSYKDLYGDNNGCEIYIQPVEEGEARRLTDNAFCDWQPRWGP